MATAADTFAGTTAADLGGQAASDGGGNWVSRDSSNTIKGDGSGAVTSNSANRGGYLHPTAPATADQEVIGYQQISSTGKTSLNIAARMNTSSNIEYFSGWSGGNGWHISKRTGSGDNLPLSGTGITYSVASGFVNSNAPTSSTASRLRVFASGSDVRCTLDLFLTGAWSNIIDVVDASATKITTAGGWGLYNSFADTTGPVLVNDWSATDYVAAGGGTTRGTPFGHRGTAFNGGRTFHGIVRRIAQMLTVARRFA